MHWNDDRQTLCICALGDVQGWKLIGTGKVKREAVITKREEN